MQKKASILDWPRPGISPEIFNEDNTLKPEVKKFILDFVHSFAQANNFKDLESWVTKIRLIGSLCTNTYNKQSDCDIHITADLKKFIEIEYPEMSEKEASDFLDQIRKQVDQVKVNLPGTSHPIEIYFENEFTPPIRMEWSGAYSILEDRWESEPHIIGKDFDVSTFYPSLIETAKETAAEIDATFGDVKREIQDIKELEETIEAWPSEQREHFEKKLQKKLDNLDEEINSLVDVREDILDQRHKSTSATSQAEITMKYLQKYFYLHILTDLKALLKQSPELTVKDIPVVENIMQQAALSKKEAALSGAGYWIAPDGDVSEITEEGATHEDMLPFNMRDTEHALEEGYTRVREGDYDVNVEVANLRSLPAHLDKFLLPYAQYVIYFGDLRGNNVNVDGDEIVTGVQKAVNNALRQQRLQPAANLKLAYQEDENRILVDMDDTICHEDDKGECGEPMEGVKEALTKLKEQGFEIVIYSHRANDKHGLDEIKKYLEAHAIPYDSIFKGDKPLGRYYIDDRAIHFDNWNSVLNQIEKSASLVSTSAQWPDAFWISPDGKMYKAETTHDEWVLNNLNLLQQYNIQISDLKKILTNMNNDPTNTKWYDMIGPFEEKVWEEMFNSGWSRISVAANNKDYVAQINSIQRVPIAAVDFFLGAPDNIKVTFEDASESNFVTVTKDDLLSGQKGINQAIRIQRQSSKALSKKEATSFSPYGDPKFKQGTPYAVFEHIQPGFGPFPDMEMYTILGDSPLFGSTVQKSKIEELGIPIKQAKEAQLHSDYDYSSTQFNLPKTLSERILEWSIKNIPAEDLFQDETETKGRQLTSHISVKYGLLTNEFEEVRKALEGEKAPHVKFGKSSCFTDKPEYDVLKIDVESPDMEALSKKLCSQVKHNDEHADYHPHVTVCYLKKGLCEKYSGVDILDGFETDLTQLMFSPKEGEKRELELVKATEKQASSFVYRAFNPQNPQSPDTLVYKDPSLEQLTNLYNESDMGLRYFITSHGEIWVWDALELIHADVMEQLGYSDYTDAGQIEDDKTFNKFVKLHYPKTEKESSFMPSNTDLAPSNDWIGEVGYPGNKEMDAPQNVSDEETWYSPENDRPRSMNFWKKMLSLFQKPLSKKEPPKNIVPVKEAKRTTLTDPEYGSFEVLENPSPNEAEGLFNRSKEHNLRYYITPNDDALYMWDSYEYGHGSLMDALGIEYTPDNYAGAGMVRSPMQAREVAQRFSSETKKQIPVTSKQWTTPVESFNQPGMAWDWSDYVYNYVNENWKDWLLGWLELDPKNYVKPVILIEQIYKDEGKVSAWVHVEFVNTTGNSDAFMKLVITADIHYEPSYEPEGVETIESLDNWEIEVLDYGKSDEFEKISAKNLSASSSVIQMPYENGPTILIYRNPTPEQAVNVFKKSKEPSLRTYIDPNTGDLYMWDAWFAEHMEVLNFLGLEFHDEGINQIFHSGDARKMAEDAVIDKESSYGPTNYKGPSVADHGYQNSAWDDMNVTYSPEEDDKFLDQDGADGYPNRWMGRHRGPYYTNEGKVLKMLEETSALETLPPQQPITENTNAGTAILMDDGSIYFSNEPHMIHVKLIKQLGLPAEHIVSGGRIVDGTYIDAGSMSDTVRYVERELARQRAEKKRQTLGKKDIKAGLAGEYWLDPSGKKNEVSGADGHGGWIISNWKNLNEVKEAGFDPNKIPESKTWDGKHTEFDPKAITAVYKQMLKNGWSRIGSPNKLSESESMQFLIEVYNVHHLPGYLDDFVAQNWNPNETNEYGVIGLEVGDIQGEDMILDDPFPTLQKAVNKWFRANPIAAALKQAAISGQVVNNILKIIQQTGGATYNLSKGNLVGTNAYAVAIYPDREQIVDGVDYDRLEGYISQNEDLLSNPNNSFGAWNSGGKTYFDVVATVADKNQAMQLGLKHKQLAIFDLKNLVEIPLQRVASLKIAEIVNFQSWKGQDFPIYVNPTFNEVLGLWKRSPSKHLRMLTDRFTGDKYLWDGYFATHDDIQKFLGLEEIQNDDLDNLTVIRSVFSESNKASKQKQAAAVSDFEQQKYYDEIYSDRWRDDSSKIDGGNEYYDWSELGSNDYPNPRDLDKERGLLDQLEKPVYRNNPVGLGEYAITYYDAFPDQGDQGGI